MSLPVHCGGTWEGEGQEASQEPVTPVRADWPTFVLPMQTLGLHSDLLDGLGGPVALMS